MAFHTKIVGVTFENHQKHLKEIQAGDILQLEQEKDNSFDKNAIKVVFKGNTLGYLKRDIALQLTNQIESGVTFKARVEEVTGKDKEIRGCNILVY